MTHVFPFHGTLSQCWDVFYSAYRRLEKALGRSPFEFESPKHSTINEYLPKDGDEIIVYFRDADHKQTILVVEAEIVPDEDREINIFVHPQGNSFEEPVKSAMAVWKEVKSALKKEGRRFAPLERRRRKKKRGMHESTLIALNHLREIHAEASKSKDTIIPRKDAAKRVGIVINTWRNNDQELWDHWEDQNMQ